MTTTFTLNHTWKKMMPEDIMDRLNRLANAGRKRPEAPKEMPKPRFDVFAHTKQEEKDKATRGVLQAMLDNVDIKHSKAGKVR